MQKSAEVRLGQLGFVLPAPMKMPAEAVFRFPWVKIHRNHAFISGHGPLNQDGSLAEPLGKVGKDVTLEQARKAAGLTALAMLGSLKQALGSLDRIDSWLRVFGMVNVAAGFDALPLVMNGFSDVILAVFGDDCGSHARCAVGMAELPFGIPVEIEAEVTLHS